MKRLFASVRALRLLALILTLACQVSASSLPAADDATHAQASLLSAAAVFCQSGQHKSTDHGPSPRRHDVGLALFGFASADSQSAPASGDGPFLPAPASGAIGERPALFEARAPPPCHYAVAFARGPPSQV